ncbi:Type IV secretory pathway, VirB6 component (plasmid) [Phaeobacter piscinae]|uniref:Type IV secretory pathway, VirB6 component n=1 Tax=Phaeobacter piscinae TaxID=1580596 RepID=A0ABN5DKR7_9RHOB|nr:MULTISPECIES: type IV secretion system protein [Phaeobacter]ATG38089.1 Type IV secretory pathway, VirB6 component [Phaeobacter piscinae]AUQ88610.1 Type IV secretory pathway, VirB6 component [Phaeobacter piscinae]AUQ92599.1 Type IV secretory pathway, VirB6 component [Phaeobacter inhibens]AUR26415.1 Type IV secretory pathway, VirB6 component [Phaeobacter piscinae]
MGVINDILSVVEDAVEAVAADGFAQAAATVGGVITAGSTLLVILLGINIVAQIRPMSFGSIFAMGIKIALVGIFAQSWANFEVIYDVATSVPDSIGASILSLTGVGSEGGLYNALDSMVNRVTAYGDAIGDEAGWVFGAFLGVIIFVIAGIYAAIAAGIVAFAKIVFTLMVIFGPFAITASLFKPTMPLFEAWSRSAIGYAIMPIAAAGAAGISVAIAETIATGGPDPENVATLSLIFPFIVVLLLSGAMMLAVPSIAMNLSGTIGLASNAVGLNRLAQQGVVKSGKGGAAGAQWLYKGVKNRITGGSGGGESSGGSPGSGTAPLTAGKSPAATLQATNSLMK